jgi:hypothetical protein
LIGYKGLMEVWTLGDKNFIMKKINMEFEVNLLQKGLFKNMNKLLTLWQQ